MNEWIWHEHKKDNQNAKIYNNRTGIKIKQSNNAISSKNPEMKPDVSCFSVFYVNNVIKYMYIAESFRHSN
jgi:hypothetical protein